LINGHLLTYLVNSYATELYTTFNKFMSQMQTEVNEQVTAFLGRFSLCCT